MHSRSARRLLVLTLACAAAAAACSDTPPESAAASSYPADAWVVAPSDSGALRFELRTAPTQPPAHGTISTELRALDATSGAPVDGLVLDVVPWMPAMGHGASIAPTTTAKGDGRYVSTNVDLFMPGRWALRVDVTGARQDHVDLAFDVP